MKKFLKYSFVIALLLISHVSHADVSDINLTVKNNGVIVFSGSIALPAAGVVDIKDTATVPQPHEVKTRSVLNVVTIADIASSSFNISNLIYYPSFSAFYLKCITVDVELCDNWQYKVNGTDPGMGMDSDILSGGENVVLFFGDENPPAPEPVVIHQSGGGALAALSGGGGGISSTPVVSVPLTTTPAVEKSAFAEVKKDIPEVKVVETPKGISKEIVKKVENKKIAKKKTAQKVLSKNTVQNTASVINSLESTKTKEISTPVAKKRSWFSWLFGF